MTSTGISARSDTADACAPSPGSSGRCGSRHPSFGGSKDISPNGRVVPAPQPHLRRCAGDDVDAKADGYTDRTTSKDPVRYMSVGPATQRPAALQGDTPRDTENGPDSREFPATGGSALPC